MPGFLFISYRNTHFIISIISFYFPMINVRVMQEQINEKKTLPTDYH